MKIHKFPQRKAKKRKEINKATSKQLKKFKELVTKGQNDQYSEEILEKNSYTTPQINLYWDKGVKK